MWNNELTEQDILCLDNGIEYYKKEIQIYKECIKQCRLRIDNEYNMIDTYEYLIEEYYDIIEKYMRIISRIEYINEYYIKNSLLVKKGIKNAYK